MVPPLSSSVPEVEVEEAPSDPPPQIKPSKVAAADARMVSPSSQQADNKVGPAAPCLEVASSELEVVVAGATQSPQLASQSQSGPSAEEEVKPSPPVNGASDTWCARAKGKLLSKKGEAFTLPSGEACIKIPNSVIEKNRKSWEPFVLGKFYSDPPSQGTLHNIVNGIWSKHYRDIAVSKKWMG